MHAHSLAACMGWCSAPVHLGAPESSSVDGPGLGGGGLGVDCLRLTPSLSLVLLVPLKKRSKSPAAFSLITRPRRCRNPDAAPPASLGGDGLPLLLLAHTWKGTVARRTSRTKQASGPRPFPSGKHRVMHSARTRHGLLPVADTRPRHTKTLDW